MSDWTEEDLRAYKIPLAEAFRRYAVDAVWTDPDRMAGAPCVRGTRIPVFAVLNQLAEYGTVDSVLVAFPHLTVEQVKEAIWFAAKVIECPLPDPPTDSQEVKG